MTKKFITGAKQRSLKSISRCQKAYSHVILKEDKVLWSGLTKTTNISKADRMVNQVAKAVYQQMVKDGFVSK